MKLFVNIPRYRRLEYEHEGGRVREARKQQGDDRVKYKSKVV